VAVGAVYTDPLQTNASTSVLTSPDGINWTSQPGGSFTLANAICYGAGQYVTVGNDGAIATSPDGTNWGFAGSLAGWPLSGVAYGSNLFVAVGKFATMLTSPDGNIWSVLMQGEPPELTFPPQISSNLMAVAYGSNVWVAVGEGILLNSPDGINWTNQPSPVYGSDLLLNSVCYGSNQFVAVGAQWPLDGVLPYTGSGTSVILVSPDGIHWSSKTKVPSSLDLNSIAYSNPGYIAVGDQGVIETSLDGVTWTNRGSSASAALYCAAFGNGTFVAAGSVFLSSPDGIHWASHANPSGSLATSITFGSNLFVAVEEGGEILVSRDGNTWATRVPASINSAVTLQSVTYGNGLFVAGGTTGGIVYTSTNGLTWHSQTGPPFTAVAYGNNEFAAVGGSGTVATSPDGAHWKVQTPPTAANLAGIAYGAGVFVAAGSSGTLMTSPDALNWTPQTNLTYYYPFQAVTFGNGVFLAVGQYGAVATSTDGYTWNGPASVTSQNLYGVTAGNGGFIAVSINGSILQSDDSVVPATLEPLILLPGGAPQFTVSASPGQSYAIQASSDLINWTMITNVSLSNTAGQFVDPSTTNYPQRFYRAAAP
jgi:hypothetical protein